MAQEEPLEDFQRRVGYTFVNPELFVRARTHKSHAHESKGAVIRHNETFEFLGDSVLGLVIGEELFHQFPEEDEGALSKMKAHLVSTASLASKARSVDLGSVLLLGVGEEKTGGRGKDSVLADAFEAFIAAVYLDGGLTAARDLILRCFGGELQHFRSGEVLFQDFKTALQEKAQSRGLPLPDYEVVEVIGPDHHKKFVVEVKVGSRTARGEGTSKKEAQQQAARQALADGF